MNERYHNRRKWLFAFALLLPLLSPALVTPLHGQEDDQRFLAGLRERRLFELAELQTAKRLADDKLSDLERAQLAIELIQSRTAAAIQSPSAEREARWQSTFSVGQQFAQQHPNNPRLLLVQVQTELARLTRGQFLSQQLAAGIAGNNLRDQALQSINLARRGLEDLERKTGLAIPQALNSSSGNPADLTAEQLRALQNKLRYQLARCSLQTAKLFPPEDQLNRLDALTSVIRRLDEVARQTNSEIPLWWNLQIDRVQAFRLLQQFDEASNELNKLATEEILKGDKRKSDFMVQQIELAIALGGGNAQPLVAAAAQIADRTAELDLAIVRLMMKQGTSAAAKADQDRWQRAASELTKTIEQSHGRYYGRLAELAVIGDTGSNIGENPINPATSTNLDILVRVGDESWRKGQLDDAVKAFDKATQQAIAEQNFDLAMQTGMKSAKIFEQQKDFETAGLRLAKLGLELNSNSSASQAHLLGCWHLAQAAKGKPELVATYAEQLQQHVQTWPTASSANQVRIWLARYQSSRKNWPAAYQSLIQVEESSTHLAAAASLLPRIVHSDLESKTEGTTPAARGNGYSQQMVAKLKKAGVGPNDTWTRASCSWLLATVELNLSYCLSDRDQVLSELAVLLNRAISESTDAEAAWQQDANAWRIALLASRRETIREATEAVSSLANAELPVIVRCWNAMAPKARSTAPADQMAQLKLEVVDLVLDNDTLAATDRNVWLGRKSTLLAALGRGGESITMLEELVSASPRRVDLRIQLATALSGEGQTEPALRQWRIVAKGVKPQTENHFQAKYNIAKLLADSGDRAGAKQLLDYLRIPPGWSKSALSAEFDNLLRELNE